MNYDYRKFGLEVIQYLDNQFLFGMGGLSKSLFSLLKTKFREPPLDWKGTNWPRHYYNDGSLLWIMDADNNKLFLPQSVLISPQEAYDLFKKIKIELHEPDFYPPYKNEKCLGFYKKDGDSNDINARLLNYRKNDRVLVFQGVHYFDWIMSNLAMDFDRSPLPTLREETSEDGRVQKLDSSPLANITGINGLLFSNDGYMIYQKRNNKVLVRPNELCSGFSGTVDKIDIQHVMQEREGPLFHRLDAAREAVEEIGISRDHIKDNNIVFLGMTRELIRGGTPELFYAIDLNLCQKDILSLTRKDKEGKIKSVNFGMYAKAINDDSVAALSEITLWKIMEKIEKESKAPVSIPFLTNLSLWYWHWAHEKVGIGSIQQ